MKDKTFMLTEQRKLFCDYYLINMNAAEAARQAGYKANNNQQFGQKGYKLLQVKEVKEYIKYRLEQVGEENLAKLNEVVKYLTSALRGQEVEKSIVVTREGHKGTFSDTINIKEFQIKPRDRINAAKLLFEYHKLKDEESLKNTNDKITFKDDIPIPDRFKNEDGKLN